MQWREAKESCEAKGKHLAVLETDSEWQFITNEIKSRNTTDKWHIGLFHTCKNWTWINGKPLKEITEILNAVRLAKTEQHNYIVDWRFLRVRHYSLVIRMQSV